MRTPGQGSVSEQTPADGTHIVGTPGEGWEIAPTPGEHEGSEPVRTLPVAAARETRMAITEPVRPPARDLDDDQLASLILDDIAAGDLDTHPSGNALRTRYGVNHARAIRLLDAIQPTKERS